MPGTKKSKSWEELRGTIDVLHRGFPDLNHTIHDVFSDGNKVVARGTTRGTHKGEFAGFEPTGEEINLTFQCLRLLDQGAVSQVALHGTYI